MFAKAKNSHGLEMQIIEYRSSSDITVKFLDGTEYQTTATIQRFKKHSIQNPLHKSAYGVGYLNVGKYKASSPGRNLSIEYDLWRAMIKRCYSPNAENRFPAYYGKCTVCDEWYNFQNFAEWYNKNIYYIPNERMHLDKDILFKDNTLYAPERCLIVPQKINMVFVGTTNLSGLPTGIMHRKKLGVYIATYNTVVLGKFKTLDEAVNAHYSAKMKNLKFLINNYGDSLPQKVSDALLNHISGALIERGEPK